MQLLLEVLLLNWKNNDLQKFCLKCVICNYLFVSFFILVFKIPVSAFMFFAFIFLF